MANDHDDDIYIARGTDHLGFLATKLGDLLGYSTLAHELIQNAGDAPGASMVSFDVRSEGLIVDNDGHFSDCEEIGERRCPWKVKQNRMCDFHRFRTVAGGDKRDEADTTGAFGIGFTAVYQITDRPELISSRRHWKVYEEEPEEKRIRQCRGCAACEASGLPGTRFILTWAKDSTTELRRKLRVDAVTSDTPKQLLEELTKAVPFALLFVKKLCRIRILQDGRLVNEFTRAFSGDTLTISDGTERTDWFILHGSFSDAAAEMRERHQGRIEDKRSAEISIAIAREPHADGRLWAYLPTQHHTGLPFHIQADFFPKSDRKNIVLDLDVKSDWNRTAIATAAQIFARNLVPVRDTIGAVQFWQVIMSLESVSREVGKEERDQVFAHFWESVQPELRANAVVLTSQNNWARPDEVALLEKKEELASLPILEALGVQIVNSDLRFAHGLLTTATVGVRLFGAIDLATALQGAGLTSRHERSDLPEFLRADAQWNNLWDECVRLLEQLSRNNSGQRDVVHEELAKCSVAPGRDGAFWPCNSIYQADDSTADLFARATPELPFVDQRATNFASLQTLCPELDAGTAISELGQVDPAQLRASLEADSSLARDLLGWFQDRRAKFRQNDGLRTALKQLPVFPASTGYESLSQLALPGGFEDPLKIAGIISVDALVGRLDFLNDLGAEKLTFETYARTHIPDAVLRDDLPVESRRGLIQLLSRKGSELRDYADILGVLADLPLVECSDGYFRSANAVYFDTALVRDVLGDVPLAELPTEHTEGVREFYRWLGVADEPRLEAVIRRIAEITANPPNDHAVTTIQRLFEHLAARVGTIELGMSATSLRTAAWLPAQGETSRWFRPVEVYALFRKSLFESQARFLDVPQRVQQQNTKFLESLGVRANPSTQQVIAHLQHRSANNEPVAENIYQYLADEAEPQFLLRLREEACIHLGDGKFVRPDQVFWQPHPFGRYRWQLGDSLRKYHELFTRLGVNESASSRDAIQVLYEIEEEFGAGNHALDPDAKLVVSGCWRRLTSAIQLDEFDSEELAPLETRKLICSPSGVLQPPQWMFFEDRPNLAAKFGRFLDNNAIKQPEGMGQAMQAAGVRFLSQAVQSHIVEKEGSVESTEVLDRIRERWDLLHRFLEFENPKLVSKLDALLEVSCVRAMRLLIAQTLKVFNRELQSNPEPAQAFLSREEGKLHYVAVDGRVPWIAISRELVGLLSPDEQPGQLALGMKDVLGGESHDFAKSVLDELQIPEIDRQSISDQPAPGVISSLGEHADDSGASDSDLDTAGEAAAEAQEVEESIMGGSPYPAEATTAAPTQASPTASGNGDGRGKAPSGGTGAGPGPGVGAGTKINGGTEENFDSENFNLPPDGRSPGAKRDRRGPGKRKGYAVLRSYVMPDRPEEDEVTTDDDGHARRTEIAQAGVNHVMQFEQDEGRHPREMPPLHKGNDIESDDADGNIERVIEVKSIAGEWLGAEAGLTKPQVEKARQLRHQYWLYVVENAPDDDHYRIHRIQDPYGQANRFMFDPGWCQVEEHYASPKLRSDVPPDSSVDGDSARSGAEEDVLPIDSAQE